MMATEIIATLDRLYQEITTALESAGHTPATADEPDGFHLFLITGSRMGFELYWPVGQQMPPTVAPFLRWRFSVRTTVLPDGRPMLEIMEAGTPILHNYTPHEIVLELPDGTQVHYASEGVARVGQVSGPQIAMINGMPVYGPSIYGAVAGLPLEAPTHYHIVSLMVAQALPDRADLLVPGTGPADGAIREKGLVVAVTRLISQAGNIAIPWQTVDGWPICPECAGTDQVHVDPDGFHVCMRCGHGWHIPALAVVGPVPAWLEGK